MSIKNRISYFRSMDNFGSLSVSVILMVSTQIYSRHYKYLQNSIVPIYSELLEKLPQSRLPTAAKSSKKSRREIVFFETHSRSRLRDIIRVSPAIVVERVACVAPHYTVSVH